MCEQGDFLRLRDAGFALADALARRNLSRDDRMRVLCALLARDTMAERRQDQWPEAAIETMERLRGYMVAEVRRQEAILSAMPARGRA